MAEMITMHKLYVRIQILEKKLENLSGQGEVDTKIKELESIIKDLTATNEVLKKEIIDISRDNKTELDNLKKEFEGLGKSVQQLGQYQNNKNNKHRNNDNRGD